MISLDAVKELLEKTQQTQLLRFWDQLGDEERSSFLAQLSTINLKNVNELFGKARDTLRENVVKLDSRMKPVPQELFGAEQKTDDEELDLFRGAGLEEISKGSVAVLLLAGGEGTRLGVSYPKGMYSVDLPSGKTLFQMQAERIRRILTLAKERTGKKGRVCWYIMTSGRTNRITRKYLEANDYFGLDENDVVLFQQGLLPCFDFEGKILLAERNSVALAPDGNGGIYRALDDNRILEDMERRGIKYVHIHSVDNILVKVADPVFIGYCIKKQADCGAKVVSKNGPNEAVGVVCKVDDRFQVVEYSEITEETAKLRDSAGNLTFRAGNICNHFFTTEFLRRIVKQYEPELKLHVAKKKIPYVDESGDTIVPSAPNGIKIEKFVFDVFQFTNKFVIWEVPRFTEFSPLKNIDSVGKDCPSTARRDLLHLHKYYVEKAGGSVGEDVEVEISPLLSYAGENLQTIVKGKSFNSSTVIKSDDECNNTANGHFKHSL
ncbi:UDP-N-acetylhexosamine pyrophosphorylase-like protein 1 [Cylas formicarius]|uniref:UDP-N-acetylhexosamine pyrophosphorylase-like protein 1 n=1 Tax=Cylas formicarius TaxID=197179 RepID=UPI0029586815|nr:UDP-N-acetylhexosamine pyrophosphorylase-like protein 1 [Cylas formicarius]